MLHFGLGVRNLVSVWYNVTRFNKIAIKARYQMAADKEAVGLSTVHMYES